MIYLDNSATTRPFDGVIDVMDRCMREQYFNASAAYKPAVDVDRAMRECRKTIAAQLGIQESGVIFTGGGTESDNWALRGVAEALGRRGKHILISAIEHHAILHTGDWLRKQGFEVELLPVDAYGKVQPDILHNALRPDTILVSVMLANNEIGTIQPIKELSAIAHTNGALFHTDAVQAVGHIPVDVEDLGVDLLSLSSHKFHGPRGVGALYVRHKTPLLPLIHGGGQERGRRSGTENVAGAVGMAAALQERIAALDTNMPRLTALRDKIIREMLRLPYARLTGHPDDRLPSIASLVFEGIEGESILLQLDARGICASSGSACSSTSLEPSHVLLAIGLPHAIAHGSVRLSLGDDITEDEVDTIIQDLTEVVNDLRVLSPVWDVAAQRPTW